MVIHPYPFKWRIFRHFGGLLVMIIRHMRRAHKLDIKIAKSSSDIENLKNELNLLKNQIMKKDGNIKKTQARARSLHKQIVRKVRKIKEEIGSFCRSVRAELRDFERSDIDDYTLLYRGARYLRHFAEVLVLSKKINQSSIESLKKGIENEMRNVEKKADALELQAKNLERGGINTVVFSEMSPWASNWIKGSIKTKAIEIGALNDKIKNDKPEEFFEDFKREMWDIYEIGRNTSVLMRRLKITFNSMKAKLRNNGISSKELDRTERFFKHFFRRLARISRQLENEIKDQSGELRRDMKKIIPPKKTEIEKLAA